MNVGQYQYIKKWKDESDLAILPTSEDDQHEYKRSAVKDDDLGNYISKAASAFWNSGGGLFIAGIDEKTSKIDGGIAAKVGRQPRLEWVDRKIAETHPPGPYIRRWIDKGASINPDRGVLVIAFGESPYAPHMAYDGKNYIRLGAHSDPARYYLVEAIRARKFVQTPVVRALLRRAERKFDLLELAILVVNDATALDVEVSFKDLPDFLVEHVKNLPLVIPVIDRNHPFIMDFLLWEYAKDKPFEVEMNYRDILGNSLHTLQTIDLFHSAGSVTFVSDVGNIQKTLNDINQNLNKMNQIAENLLKASSPNRADSPQNP